MCTIVEAALRELARINVEEMDARGRVTAGKWGELCMRMTGEGPLFSVRESKGKVRMPLRELGLAGDPRLIGYLSNRYFREKLTALEKDKKLLQDLIDEYRPYDYESIAAKMSSTWKLAADRELDQSAYQELLAWADAEYESNPKPFSPYCNVTFDGHYVRSMAENMIYTLLKMHGIPFRYEEKLVLQDADGMKVVRYPDFTAMTRVRQCLYVEYAGMLSDPQYMEGFTNKLALYHRNGIRLGQNLIVLTDTPDGRFDAEAAERIILGLILPQVRG